MIPFAWGLDSVMSIFASISQAWPPRSQGTLKWYARLNFKPLGHSFVYVLFLKWFLVHLFEQSLILTSNWSSSLHQAQTATNNWDIVPNHDFSMSWVDNDIIFVFPYISLRTIETFEHHLAPILAPHHLRPHSMWHYVTLTPHLTLWLWVPLTVLCEAPADPILGLVSRFKADPAKKKAGNERWPWQIRYWPTKLDLRYLWYFPAESS